MKADNLWTWEEVCVAVGASAEPGPHVHGVSIDTRTLGAGDLFVALAGDPGPAFNPGQRSTRDGHDFVGAARAAGAAGALVHRRQPEPLPQIVVADTLDALWALGAAARRRCTGTVFAVTGSSGKTTVKAFLAAALSCPAAAGSLNNFWGVPLSLSRTPRDADAAVFEIGTNHAGEIEPLALLVAPDVGLVVNVHPAHVGNFASLDELRAEKLCIVHGLVEGGALVVPDDLDVGGVRATVRLVRFGASAAADVQLLAYDAARQRARYAVGKRRLDARVPGGGHHRALSLAAVLACLHAAGKDPALAVALDDALVPHGRGRRRGVGGVGLIDDSYNANPVSMAAALDALAGEPGGRRFALLGEMLELGGESERWHRGLAGHCRGLDGVFCVGKGMRALYDALPTALRLGYADTADAVPLDALVRSLVPGDHVLIKGSNRVFWVSSFAETFARQLAAATHEDDDEKKAR